jgi:hypothetical protein
MFGKVHFCEKKCGDFQICKWNSPIQRSILKSGNPNEPRFRTLGKKYFGFLEISRIFSTFFCFFKRRTTPHSQSDRSAQSRVTTDSHFYHWRRRRILRCHHHQSTEYVCMYTHIYTYMHDERSIGLKQMNDSKQNFVIRRACMIPS